MNAKQRAKIEMLRGQLSLITEALNKIDSEEMDKFQALAASNLVSTYRADEINWASEDLGKALEKLRECDELLEGLSQAN